ncbi:MAG: chorismate mutase [Alphaproteobacteria bacterium]|jgi:chorismate mutase|nr:chorismate mutase [Alphaproteobacteria bacterium]
MEAEPTRLESLRREVDRIDDTIHDLLMRRAALVKEIAQAKGAGGSSMRPSRESQILKRLADRHDGSFPLSVVVRLWRELFGCFNRLQSPFAVAVSVTAETRDLWDMARDHYGSLTPITAVAAPIQAVRLVLDGKATVAVVPWPDDREVDPWWRALVAGNGKRPRVISRLPVMQAQRTESRRALAVGQLPLEPTGDDHSLIGIELAEAVSRSRLKDLVERAGFHPVAFWSCGPGVGQDAAGMVHLVEVVDFIGDDDLRLARLSDRLGGVGKTVLPIGGFGMPLPASDLQKDKG